MRHYLYALDVDSRKCRLNGILRITLISVCVLFYLIFLLHMSTYFFCHWQIQINPETHTDIGKKNDLSVGPSMVIILNIRHASINNPKLSEFFWAFFIRWVAKKAVLEHSPRADRHSLSHRQGVAFNSITFSWLTPGISPDSHVLSSQAGRGRRSLVQCIRELSRFTSTYTFMDALSIVMP